MASFRWWGQLENKDYLTHSPSLGCTSKGLCPKGGEDSCVWGKKYFGEVEVNVGTPNPNLTDSPRTEEERDRETSEGPQSRVSGDHASQ